MKWRDVPVGSAHWWCGVRFRRIENQRDRGENPAWVDVVYLDDTASGTKRGSLGLMDANDETEGQAIGV